MCLPLVVLYCISLLVLVKFNIFNPDDSYYNYSNSNESSMIKILDFYKLN